MKCVYLILASLLLPIYSEAVPVKFSECTKTTKVKEPKNSSGFFFDDSCQVAYVLPPQSGSLEIYGLSPTGDLESACQSYSNIMKSEESYSKSILILAQSIEDSNEQISKYNEYLSKGLFPVGMTEADLQSKIQNLLSLALDYQNKYAELIEGLRNLKKHYATDEGATGKFYLESQYSSLIAEFQKKNPKIQFVRIPLEQSYISINEKSYSPENASMSAVLSLQADTIGTLPVIKGFNETEAAELLPVEVLPGGIFTDSMGGDIAFSVIGACAFLKKNGTLPEKVSPDKISTYINANVIYQYHVQMHRKHKITYNLAQLAKRIESSSQKGGFFSRKSVHSLTEKTESKKWIHFEAYSDDPHYTYTDKYTQEIKEQFLNSVLQEVAYVSFDNPGKYPSVVLPEGQTGAGVVGEALGKCPHLYCTVASYAMKFLDTTFGKKSAISEFIRTRDVDISESLDEKQMVPYVGSYTFK